MADPLQNFTDAFHKLGEQLKVPPFDMGKIMEHHRKNLDAMTRSWQAVAGGAQEIAKKQGEILKAAFKEISAMAQDYKPAGSPQELMAKQAEFAKKTFEAALANTRDFAQLTQRSAGEAIAIVHERMKESFEEIRTGLEKKK
jgi:phasin family protein